jgi:hypothetical protein
MPHEPKEKLRKHQEWERLPSAASSAMLVLFYSQAAGFLSGLWEWRLDRVKGAR